MRFENSKVDPITAFFQYAVRWLMTKRQTVAIVAGSILVIGLFAVYVGYNIYKLRKAYWDRLSVAYSHAAQNNFDVALQNISTIKARRISGNLATHADLLKGDIYFKQGKLDEAVKAYKDAYTESRKEELKVLALINLATTEEQMGKPKEALEIYKTFLNDYPDNFMAARVYNSLGRVQTMLGLFDDAEESYERLITLYPTTSWARSGRIYLDNIKYIRKQAQKKQ